MDLFALTVARLSQVVFKLYRIDTRSSNPAEVCTGGEDTQDRLAGSGEGHSSEARLCPREDRPGCFSDRGKGAERRGSCFSGNQSLGLWLLVLRDKVVMLIWWQVNPLPF